MEITGVLKVKNETKEYGANGFKKREFVITTDSSYPQFINIELHQDKCSLIDNYNVGDEITVNYNINGKEWINPQGEAKYFNSIVGWRIEKLKTAPNTPKPPLEDLKPNNVGEQEDLPF